MSETNTHVETGGGTNREENLIKRVEDFVRKFVFFEDESLYTLVAVWIVATHLHSEFEYIGYIFATSAGPSSGKSRLLEVLDLLVCNSSGVLVSPTEAVLFHTAEDHTQLLDEVDSCSDRETLRSVLNAGFRKGNVVKRMVKNGAGNYEPKSHPVYGPRALAGIGSKILPETTRDRTFVLEMVPQKRGEKRERLIAREVGPEATHLKQDIEKWVAENRRRVRSAYDSSDFSYLDDFRDRTIDVSQPLAAVLEVGGTGDQTPCLIRAVAITRKEDEHLAVDRRILSAITGQCSATEPLVGSASEIASLCGMDEHTVSTTLRRYGFKTKSKRGKNGGTPKYRYSLERDKLEDILARYCGPDCANPKAA